MTVRRNEIIEQIASMAASILREGCIDNSTAEQVGYSFSDAISSSFGGQQFCIPTCIDTLAATKKKSIKTFSKERATKRRYDLLDFIEATIVGLVAGLPLKNITPKEAANLLKERFCKHFLQESFVIPKDAKFKRYQRDQNIIKEFNGLNLCHLSEKYNLSENAIYRILKKY